MTKLKIFGVAALVMSTALATPAMAAQDNAGNQPHKQITQKQTRATPHKMQRHVAYRHDYRARGTMARNEGMAYREGTTYRDNRGYRGNMAYRDDNNGWNNDQAWNDNRRDPAFWPGDVAAGVVGGAVATAGAAVNTAGAIATAPFRNDSYAYYNDNNGWNGYNNGGYDNAWNNQTYAQRNGFVCQPGTWFRGEDGRQHLCQ